jgi:hypothetical protein
MYIQKSELSDKLECVKSKISKYEENYIHRIDMCVWYKNKKYKILDIIEDSIFDYVLILDGIEEQININYDGMRLILDKSMYNFNYSHTEFELFINDEIVEVKIDNLRLSTNIKYLVKLNNLLSTYGLIVEIEK